MIRIAFDQLSETFSSWSPATVSLPMRIAKMRLRPALLFLTTAAFTAACPPLAAQSPSDMTLSLLVDGTRIRANGPGVRDLVRPSVGDLFRRGLLSLVIRPAAEGVVVDAAPESLRFTESRRDELLEVPWVGIDYVDVHEGRSAGVGMLPGAGLGALTGLAMWGLIEGLSSRLASVDFAPPPEGKP
jgi:hypothetical protein